MTKDHDEVRAAVEAKRDAGAVKRRLGGGLARIADMLTGGTVPGEVRRVLEESFGNHTFGHTDVIARNRVAIGAAVASFSGDAWHKLVRALIPQVAGAAIPTLFALPRKPYQVGMGRRPFRCPRSPAEQARVTITWLLNTTVLVGEYDADIKWMAAHGAHLASWNGGADLGWLFAGAIDAGDATGREVREILVASARGEHETGRMGRHVTQALMSAADPEGWAFVERLLLAAQREEGLRQAILESVDESHPEAFRRMLRLILEEDLVRFSSVVRAVDVWFGFLWDGASNMKADQLVRQALAFLDDESARKAAFDEKDGETVYLALWATAFEDVDAAVGAAAGLLASPHAEVRFVAAHLLAQSQWSTSLPPLISATTDADLRIAARAMDAFRQFRAPADEGARLFANLEGMMSRLTKRSQTLEPIVWPWTERKLDRPSIAQAMAAQEDSVEADRLLPYIPDLDPFARATFIRRTAGLRSRWERPVAGEGRRALAPATRAVIIELLGDGSPDVRLAAFEALANTKLADDEVARLCELLDRKSGDLRNQAIVRLRTLDDARLLATTDRLLADASEGRQRAGLELLRDAAESGRSRAAVAERLAKYAGMDRELSRESRAHVDAVLGGDTTPATRDDALGLIDPRKRRAWPAPRAKSFAVDTKAAAATLKVLAELVLEHQAVEVPMPNDEKRLLIEATGWGFRPGRTDHTGKVMVSDGPPLAAVWRTFFDGRAPALRDADGLELLRIRMASMELPLWNSGPVNKVRGLGQYNAGSHFLQGIVEWGVAWAVPAGGFDLLVDAFEDSIAAFSDSDFAAINSAGEGALNMWYHNRERPAWRDKYDVTERRWRDLHWWRTLFPDSATPALIDRYYGSLRVFAHRIRVGTHMFPRLEDYLILHSAGRVDVAEFIDLLIGPDAPVGHRSNLHHATSRKLPPGLAERPELLDALERVRTRIVDIETQRGDRETAASPLALDLRTTGGLDTVMRAVASLGTGHFVRGSSWSATVRSRQQTLSHLVLRSIPRAGETPEVFAAAAKQAKLKPARLVELALYAPQWVAHVEHTLEWPGLEDAVWWIEAHTKDDRSWQLGELKELWTAAVSERTPLVGADLTEGAVDVEWFHRARAVLGAKRWTELDKAAKYAASAGGHTRAQLFSRAMAGEVTREELEVRIVKSRHQDSVRALGLVPLTDGEAGAKDLLTRYQLLERFKRESRKFGSQRQASEGRAVTIGTENLARTAGYRDPQRLQWAMERAAVADLAEGPVVLTKGDVTLTLSVDDGGVPSIAVARAGKALKSLPAAIKKDADVTEFQARLQELKRQRSRVRDALETAMNRGDHFEGPELRELLAHPILAPSLSRLVLLGDGIAGYAVEGGRALKRHDGTLQPVGDREELRVAHPDDLRTLGDWSDWQRECLSAERVQPFKQVFRELYPRTESERGALRSLRYAGHQVQPRQGLALLGGRGWVVRPEEGVSRTFHDAGLTVHLGFQETFYTPADVEGLTLEDVSFTKKGAFEALSLDTIPPRLFSEVMRDLDLVVSVAHRGGVDPEATASTVEMRATLVRESAALLGLENVEVLERHVIVRGKLAEYSVHLGSGGVTVMPGTAIPLVAVHSQHRGRLFLPFADDDPRSAEVLSKVLLLSRDDRIKDPNLLTWIREAKR